MKPSLTILKFLALNAVAALMAFAFLAATQPKRSFSNGETLTNLPLIPTNERFPLVIMGASHGRVFSETGNHPMTERALGRPVRNLSQESGGGVRSMDLYLSYFYRRGNRADCLLYLIHPYALGSEVFNEFHDRLREEPFRLDFLAELFRKKYPPAAIAGYVQNKFSPAWIQRGLEDTASPEGEWRTVKSVNPDAVKARDVNMYPDGFTPARFARYLPYLEDMLALAESHGTRVILVFPPTLLGRQRGMAELKAYLEKNTGGLPFVFRDFHDAVGDLALFRDLDHLNRRGSVYFAEAFLRPLLPPIDPKSESSPQPMLVRPEPLP